LVGAPRIAPRAARADQRRMLKLVVAAVAAACLVVPAVASAEEGDCADGSTLTAPLDGQRCPAQAEGEEPGAEPEDPDAEDGDERGDDGDRGDAPHFAAGFLNRVWRIAGSADGFDDGVLDFTAARFMKLPRRFADQDDDIVGEDSRVLVTPRTRVLDADHHRLTADDAASALDDADRVVVLAKLLPQARWLEDEDGEQVPTLRAKRVIIRA
jgi:hypothetical protein